MQRKIKTVGVAFGLFCVALIMLYAVSAVLVKPQLLKLEQKNIQQSTSRAIDNLQYDQQFLFATSQDWSSWDDMYIYAAHPNADFTDTNMPDSSLQHVRVNYVLIVDTHGKLIYSKGSPDSGEGTLPVPAGLIDAFTGAGKLQTTGVNASASGILALKSGLVMVAGHPILDSAGNGPVRGTFVFARALDSDEIALMKDQTKLKTKLFTTGDPSLPSDVKSVQSSLSTNQTIVKTLTTQYGGGYRLLSDAFGKPTIIARVEVPRDLAAQANTSLNYYLVAAGLIALLMALLNGMAVNRITRQKDTIKVKDEFFSVASHELRTPLTAIKGNSELAKDLYGNGNPQLSEMMDDIHSSSDRLIRIVTNFLDAARLEQGRITFQPELLSVSGLLDEVASQLQGLATEKELTVDAHVTDKNLTVFADKDRVEEVIYNLLGNAIKYTKHGNITLSAQAGSKGMTTISVADTGLGISETGRTNLFSKFEQTRHDDVSKGSGLGLYITKMLVEKMGGKIWIEPASGSGAAGTTISFTLPMSSKN